MQLASDEGYGLDENLLFHDFPALNQLEPAENALLQRIHARLLTAAGAPHGLLYLCRVYEALVRRSVPCKLDTLAHCRLRAHTSWPRTHPCRMQEAIEKGEWRGISAAAAVTPAPLAPGRTSLKRKASAPPAPTTAIPMSFTQVFNSSLPLITVRAKAAQ
jgi:hypothetical protein